MGSGILAVLAGCDDPAAAPNTSIASPAAQGCYGREGFKKVLIAERTVQYGPDDVFRISTFAKIGRSNAILLYVKPDKYLIYDRSGHYIFEDAYRPSDYKGHGGALFAEVLPELEGTSIDLYVSSDLVRFNKVPMQQCGGMNSQA